MHVSLDPADTARTLAELSGRPWRRPNPVRSLVSGLPHVRELKRRLRGHLLKRRAVRAYPPQPKEPG